MPAPIRGLDLGRQLFKSDLKRLPADVRAEANRRIAQLVKHPLPTSLRMHALRGFRPNIYVIDLASNHAYQASFNLIDGIAVMRRVGTHKSISRAP